MAENEHANVSNDDPKAGWCDECKDGCFGNCVMIPERGIEGASCSNYKKHFRAHPAVLTQTCPKCGVSQVGPQHKFCSSCGTELPKPQTISNVGAIDTSVGIKSS